MDGRLRAFVALMLGRELGSRVRGAVDRALGETKVRAHSAGDLHLTLFFLGALERERVPDVERALAAIAARHAAPELCLTRAGAFPERGRERVLWIDVAERGAPRLRRLQADVEAAAVELGFAADEREWRAHLSVARVKAAGSRRAKVVVPDSFFALDLALEWKPSALSLVESSAGKLPANSTHESYRSIADFPLVDR